MPATFPATRTQIILGLCIPLAVLLGFFLATPFQLSSVAIVVIVLGTLAFPLVLRWHHPLLILSWNATMLLGFLPGGPPPWLLMAFLSFVLFLLDRSIRERSPVNRVSSVSVPLIAFLGVVLGTAALTGGIGIRSLGGGSYGGKGYVFILASVLGYFAIASQPLKKPQVSLYCGMFFLAGLTALVPNLVYLGGQSVWWLFYLFPARFAVEQARGDVNIGVEIVRIYGFGPASIALLSWLCARHGIRGAFVWQRPWRMVMLVAALVAALYSGFRSFLILAVLIFVFQFFLEGLHRTRYAWMIGGTVLIAVPLLFSQPQKLPLVVQRSISFLPIEVSPVAKASADMSTEWRLEMWRSLLPEIPRHLLLGKGYAIDPNELSMALETSHRGYVAYQGAETAGDYHNGPLSVIIPFGLWGACAFLWFIGASIRFLYGNYRHGDPSLRRLNTALLSLFLAKTVFFLLVFGMLYVDLPFFTGLVGFAVCANGRDWTRASKRTGQQRLRPGEEAPEPAPELPSTVNGDRSV